MRILVRSPNWVGDQILAYPFFHFLRRAYPRAHLAAACTPWVDSLQYRNLVDDVIVLPRRAGRGLADRIRTIEAGAAALRARGPFDLGFALPDSFSSAWQLFRARARERVGYVTDSRGLLLSKRLRRPTAPPIHRAESYVALLPESARPGKPVSEFWGIPPENDLDPGVKGVLERFDFEKAWGGAEFLERPAGDYWVLAPGSLAESRRWPVKNFLSVARTIAAETGWKGVVAGGPSEAPLAAQLCEDASLALVNLCGKGSVAGLARVFQGAKFTLSNDSGLAHVASLCGSPVQIVWGAGDPKVTSPVGPGKVRVLFNPVDCWPCERNVCYRPPSGKRLECLSGISPDSVWEEIRSGLLSKRSAP